MRSPCALKQGYKDASSQRLADLKAEYGEVSRYLAALTGMNPTATRVQILATMRNKISRRRTSKRSAMGAEPGTLHAGPGGWNKVVDRLVEIGVLGDYWATGDKGEPKFAVALLYRPALGVKLVGA